MKSQSKLLSITLDFLILIIAILAASSIQWNFAVHGLTRYLVKFGLIAIPVFLAFFYLFRLYHRIWQYASIYDFLSIIGAISGGALTTLFFTYLFLPSRFLSIVPVLWLTLAILLGIERALIRMLWVVRNRDEKCNEIKRALIVGAGEAGAFIVRTLLSTKTGIGLQPVGFVDDDTSKRGLRLYGLPVFGNSADIPEIVRKQLIEEVIIAIPTASTEQVRKIARYCRQAQVKVKILPSVLDLIEGKNVLGQIRDLKMEDLLHRTEVEINLVQISEYLRDQVVLVTGAGGSIGSELCRQICFFHPAKLILLGRGENSIYDIKLKLDQDWPHIQSVPVIADIRDRENLMTVFSRYKPTVVFHAAAHKHVDLMERHPEEAFKNNVFGTSNLAYVAHLFQTNKFVMISTDKAVNPTGIMGLSKLLAEMVVRYYSTISQTKFITVRFGNVLGSRGSVVHLFRWQISKGGPITITHPHIRRYFMTIKEAVKLVIQTGALALGGEIFVLDMGEQVKIVDLARDMIELSGRNSATDIEIKFIGLKPGEKLAEELLTDKERAESTLHKKIFAVKNAEYDPELIELILREVGFPGEKQIEELKDRAIDKLTKRSRNND